MIRLVTFDLDNTLWSVDGVIRCAQAKQDAWLTARAPEYGRLDGEQLAAARRTVLAAHPRARHDISLLRQLVLRGALERCGCGAAEATRLADGAFVEFLDWRHRVDYFPDALAVLEELAGDFVLAALTNGNADYRRLGLHRYFSFGCNAAEAGASKPHPAMFERALARAGVAPAEAVHVGDHLIDDVQGANGAGLASIWVRFGRACDDPGATAVAEDLADVPRAIAGLTR